jgi:hypothetical protein
MLGGLNNLYRMSLLLTADIRGFTTGLARAETRLLRFSGTINKFGQSLNRGVGLAFGIVGAAAVQAAAEFDRANAILGQIVGRNNLKPLTDEAKRLGRETVFLAREASEAQLELAKLGFSADEVNAVLGRSTKLATVFGTDLDKTGKTIASTLRQFGLSLRGAEGLQNVTEVTDVMAVAFRESALDLDKFREAMKNVGPTARSTGLDLYETTALLAVLANNAVDGSLGGTKLRSTLSDLAKQFPEAREGLELLNDQTLTYSDLVELLNKRAALVGAIFNKNGVEIKAFEAALRSAGGATDEMADGIESNLFFQVDKLKNAFKAIGQELGDALAPTVETLASSFETFAKALEETDEKKLQSIVSTLTALVGLGAASQVLGFIGIAMGRVSKLTSKFSKGMVRSGVASATLTRSLVKTVPIAAALGVVLGNIINLLLGKEVAGFRVFEDVEADSEAAESLAASAQAIADARKRLSDEEARPSFKIEDLVEFTGVDNLEDVNKRIDHFNKKIRQSKDEMLAQSEATNGLVSFYGEHKEHVRQYGIEIDRLEKLGKLLEAQEESERKAAEARALAEQQDRLEKLLSLRRRVNSETSATQQIMEQLAKTEADARGEFFVTGDDLALAKALESAYHQAAAALNAIGEVELSDQIRDEYLRSYEALAVSLDNSADNAERLADNLYAIEGSLATTRTLTDLFEKLEKFDLEKVIPTDPLERFKDAAQAFADVFGEAFINSRRESERFFDAFKESFNRAFQAVIGKLITLIALYTILAVVSGGASMAGGGKFGPAFKNYFKTNDLGAFLGEGFGIGTRSSASGIAINGERGGLAEVAVRGAVSGNNLVILNQTGPRSVDRTFG